VNGKFSLGTLIVNGIEFGALSASILTNANEMRVTDGQLSERDGGGVQFSLVAPRSGENKTTLEATLDRVNARTLLALSPLGSNERLASDTQGDLSGKINITGIPKAMSGSADLRLGQASWRASRAGYDRARDFQRLERARRERRSSVGCRSRHGQRQLQH
jgi:hypothetical protein